MRRILRMTLKIEFDQSNGKVTLECSDGENVTIDGPLEQVNSKHLEDALMFIVSLVRKHNKEELYAAVLSPWQDWMEIMTTKEAFNEMTSHKLKVHEWLSEHSAQEALKLKNYIKSMFKGLGK
jgi:hypothetical protein